MLTRPLAILLLFICGSGASAHESHWRAHYLANAGVMIERDDIKVLFDPFFRNSYDHYDLVPAKIEADLFAGAHPWNGIDAIFVSHHHDDHFDPAVMLDFLLTWPDVHLYAPAQAVDALLNEKNAKRLDAQEPRVHRIDLDHGDDAARFELGALQVEAVRIAHAGWPVRHTDVENLLFRVTIGDATTVIHMGDADKGQEHYAAYGDFWTERKTHLAMPPVWLMLTDDGRDVLNRFIDAAHEIGIHVYSGIPDEPAERPPEFEGLDIFTEPGETRQSADP